MKWIAWKEITRKTMHIRFYQLLRKKLGGAVNTMDIEQVLGSKLRVKILKILTRVGELNVSEIARRLGVNYSTTNKHLKILEGEGILGHKEFGRIRLYRLNEHSPKAKAVQKLMEAWEHANKHKTTLVP